MASRLAELITVLKEVGQRQMREGLVRSQGDSLPLRRVGSEWKIDKE